MKVATNVPAIIHFTDKDSYVKNAQAPETHKDYREMLQYMEGEPEWIDLHYISYSGKPLAVRDLRPPVRVPGAT